MERQGVYEALSGPEVQQAGTDRISTERIRRHVEHFYPHLSDAQRATIVRRLDAGQQVQAIRPMSSDIAVPSTVPHVNAFWGQVLRDNHFVVTQLLSVNRATANGTLTVTVEVRGQLREPGQAPVTTTMTLTSEGLDDQTLLRDGRARVANPERYAWDVEETALGNGLFRRSARAAGACAATCTTGRSTPARTSTSASSRATSTTSAPTACRRRRACCPEVRRGGPRGSLPGPREGHPQWCGRPSGRTMCP